MDDRKKCWVGFYKSISIILNTFRIMLSQLQYPLIWSNWSNIHQEWYRDWSCNTHHSFLQFRRFLFSSRIEIIIPRWGCVSSLNKRKSHSLINPPASCTLSPKNPILTSLCMLHLLIESRELWIILFRSIVRLSEPSYQEILSFSSCYWNQYYFSGKDLYLMISDVYN